jgi:hypothetical protein
MADEETEYISVVQAVKLIPRNFDGNPKHLREFCEGVESARQVVNPTKYPLLLKFVESKITGEAKDRLLARRERNTWEQIKTILEENYAVRRTLEYYAGMLFTAKQGNGETVAQWGSRIDNMGIDLLREARTRIEKINPQAAEGGAILVLEFMKGSFVAGLRDDRVKYIVKAKGEEESLAQLVETALQEESDIKSHSVECYKCHRVGHIARDCRIRDSQIDSGERTTCEKCHRVGHSERNCRARGVQGNLRAGRPQQPGLAMR